MNILISSTGGSEQLGGIYDYEFNVIEKHASTLARAEFEHTKNLHWSTRFEAQIVIVVVRGHDFNSQNIRLDLVNRLSVLSQKKGRKVYLLTESSFDGDDLDFYRLHGVDGAYLREMKTFNRCYYLFKRHGSLRLERDEYYKDPSRGFRSVDWVALEEFVLRNT